MDANQVIAHCEIIRQLLKDAMSNVQIELTEHGRTSRSSNNSKGRTNPDNNSITSSHATDAYPHDRDDSGGSDALTPITRPRDGGEQHDNPLQTDMTSPSQEGSDSTIPPLPRDSDSEDGNPHDESVSSSHDDRTGVVEVTKGLPRRSKSVSHQYSLTDLFNIGSRSSGASNDMTGNKELEAETKGAEGNYSAAAEKTSDSSAPQQSERLQFNRCHLSFSGKESLEKVFDAISYLQLDATRFLSSPNSGLTRPPQQPMAPPRYCSTNSEDTTGLMGISHLSAGAPPQYLSEHDVASVSRRDSIHSGVSDAARARNAAIIVSEEDDAGDGVGVNQWLNDNFSLQKRRRKTKDSDIAIERSMTFAPKSAMMTSLEVADGCELESMRSVGKVAGTEEDFISSANKNVRMPLKATSTSDVSAKAGETSDSGGTPATPNRCAPNLIAEDSSSAKLYDRQKTTSEFRMLSDEDTINGALQRHQIPFVNVNDQDYNIFQGVEEHGTEHIFLFVTANVFFRYRIICELDLDAEKLINFLRLIESWYNNENPYHNSTHAADVVQTTHIYLQHNEVWANFTAEELLALLFSALVHDVGHLGISNSFLVRTSHPLSLIYNDYSPQESMHAFLAFYALSLPDCNFFEGSSVWKTDMAETFRDTVMQVVVGTDMKYHASMIQVTKDILEDGKIDDEEVPSLLKAIVHAADISNPCKPLEIYKFWLDRVNAEFWQQGTQEQLHNLKVSAMCDRHEAQTLIPKFQAGFIKCVVCPLMEELALLLPPVWMERVHSNLAYFESLAGHQFDVGGIHELASNEWINKWGTTPSSRVLVAIGTPSINANRFLNIKKASVDLAAEKNTLLEESRNVSSMAALEAASLMTTLITNEIVRVNEDASVMTLLDLHERSQRVAGLVIEALSKIVEHDPTFAGGDAKAIVDELTDAELEASAAKSQHSESADSSSGAITTAATTTTTTTTSTTGGTSLDAPVPHQQQPPHGGGIGKRTALHFLQRLRKEYAERAIRDRDCGGLGGKVSDYGIHDATHPVFQLLKLSNAVLTVSSHDDGLDGGGDDISIFIATPPQQQLRQVLQVLAHMWFSVTANTVQMRKAISPSLTPSSSTQHLQVSQSGGLAALTAQSTKRAPAYQQWIDGTLGAGDEGGAKRTASGNLLRANSELGRYPKTLGDGNGTTEETLPRRAQTSLDDHQPAAQPPDGADSNGTAEKPPHYGKLEIVVEHDGKENNGNGTTDSNAAAGTQQQQQQHLSTPTNSGNGSVTSTPENKKLSPRKELTGKGYVERIRHTMKTERKEGE